MANEAGSYLIGRQSATLPPAAPASEDKLFAAQRIDGQQLEEQRFHHCTFANISFKDTTLRRCEFLDCAFLNCYFPEGSPGQYQLRWLEVLRLRFPQGEHPEL